MNQKKVTQGHTPEAAEEQTRGARRAQVITGVITFVLLVLGLSALIIEKITAGYVVLIFMIAGLIAWIFSMIAYAVSVGDGGH